MSPSLRSHSLTLRAEACRFVAAVLAEWGADKLATRLFRRSLRLDAAAFEIDGIKEEEE